MLKDYFKDNLNPPALRAIPIRERENILDLLNIQYIISPSDEDKYLRSFAHFRNVNKHLDLIYDKEVKIYKRPNTFPRAFIVHRAIFQPDKNTSLALIYKIEQQINETNMVAAFDLIQKADKYISEDN